MFSNDLAIDLGTTSTRVYVPGRGIVLQEPSVVAINAHTGLFRANGRPARDLLGRAPRDVLVVQPLKNGVISDFDVTEKMLKYFIRKAQNHRRLLRPRIVIGVPSEITQVEKRAVIDSAFHAKANEVYLVDQAIMAALGAGLPITEPYGNMIVDIGGGTTDIAVISVGGTAYSRSLPRAGNHMDGAIIDHLQRKYHLLVGERTAEQIKIDIGSAWPLRKTLVMEIRGRNIASGMPSRITIDDAEVREVLNESIAQIVTAIRLALESTPPELSADVSDRGIVLSGGGALLKNLDVRIREEIGVPVFIAEDPLCSVVLGTAKMLGNFNLLQKMTVRLDSWAYPRVAA